MKTKYFIGAALVAVLHCATINAQVIGGNAVGGLGGSLGGNLSRGGIDVIGQGSGRGSLGSDLDGGSLRRTTGDLAGRAHDRTRDTLDNTRTRAKSTASRARETTRNVASSGVTSARDGADAAANVARNDVALDAAADASHEQKVAASSIVPEVKREDKNVSASGQDTLPLVADANASARGDATASKEQGVSMDGSANGSISASAAK